MPFTNFHSARQLTPNRALEYRTIKLTEGITAVLMGRADEWKVQTVRADKTVWTLKQFKNWLIDHKMKVDLVEPAQEE